MRTIIVDRTNSAINCKKTSTRLPGDWIVVNVSLATREPAHGSTLTRGLPLSRSCRLPGVAVAAKAMHLARGSLVEYRFRTARQLARGKRTTTRNIIEGYNVHIVYS